MTDTPDIEALVAEAHGHEAALMELLNGELKLVYLMIDEPGKAIVERAAKRIHDLADALERQQAVVKAAREYRQKNESHMVQSPFARKLIKALAALDAPPDETKPHPYSPDYQAMGDCRTCGRLERDPIHDDPPAGWLQKEFDALDAPPEGEG